MSRGLYSVTLLPTSGHPLAEIHDSMMAIPRKGEVIVINELAFTVVQVTHRTNRSNGGPSIEIAVEKIGDGSPYRG